jgi:hypothetical protein
MPTAYEVQVVVVRGEDKGKRWILVPTIDYDIGRNSSNRIVLNDRTVSKRHALIQFVDGIWFLQDLGSKHGTWVNDEQVKERRALFDKDIIRLGKSIMVYGHVRKRGEGAGGGPGGGPGSGTGGGSGNGGADGGSGSDAGGNAGGGSDGDAGGDANGSSSGG